MAKVNQLTKSVFRKNKERNSKILEEEVPQNLKILRFQKLKKKTRENNLRMRTKMLKRSLPSTEI